MMGAAQRCRPYAAAGEPTPKCSDVKRSDAARSASRGVSGTERRWLAGPGEDRGGRELLRSFANRSTYQVKGKPLAWSAPQGRSGASALRLFEILLQAGRPTHRNKTTT